MDSEQKPSPWGLALVSLLACAAAIAGVMYLSAQKKAAFAQEVDKRKQEVAVGPFVRVAKVKLTPSERTVTLTSEVRANQRSTIYAKVSGYLKSITVDKGDVVRKGQLLAELESPDADQAVIAANADLMLRKQLHKRNSALAPSGVVTQTELEQTDANEQVAVAAVARAQASKEYEQLRAPFAGVVTARYADPGALLPAATASTTAAQPLLEIAQIDKLRVAVQLGQDEAAVVRPGDVAVIDLSDGTQLTAKVTRLSRALDLKTRTMLAEVDLLAPPPGLLPGAFVPVTLTLRGLSRPQIPAEALLSQGGLLMVATVTDNKLHLVPVRTGIDDGRNIEVVSGLRGGELVALNLGNDAREGQPVQVPSEPVNAGLAVPKSR